MDERCQTCTHWRVKQENPRLGTCDVLLSTAHSHYLYEGIAPTHMGQHSLLTGDGFGCIHHELSWRARRRCHEDARLEPEATLREFASTCAHLQWLAHRALGKVGDK